MTRVATAAALLLASLSAQASEALCLAEIMYAEARGSSIEGVMTLSECAVTRAQKQKRSICGIKGVQRKKPQERVLNYYLALARHLLANPSTSLSKGCDSWDAGTRPHMPGRITRQIDGQVYYELRGSHG